jgi:hypothetical protein
MEYRSNALLNWAFICFTNIRGPKHPHLGAKAQQFAFQLKVHDHPDAEDLAAIPASLQQLLAVVQGLGNYVGRVGSIYPKNHLVTSRWPGLLVTPSTSL